MKACLLLCALIAILKYQRLKPDPLTGFDDISILHEIEFVKAL